jgi:tRNA dimethylallyltransferase
MSFSVVSDGMADDVIVLTGATATGKTDLAIALAQRIGAEIISMDSRQVYAGMDIGTAKASAAQRAQVPHYGLDRVTPDQRYSAGRFAREARQWIAAIRGRGRVAMLVGGTGFFLHALTHPMFEEPPLEAERRTELHAVLEAMDCETLRRWVRRLDPDSPIALEGGGRQRLARTIEIPLLTGRSLSWWQVHAPQADRPLRAAVFVLERPADALRARIDARVHEMVSQGLADEVRGLLAAGYTEQDPGMSATGYGEFIPHVRGEYSLQRAIELTQAATRRYARRQRTWFRHQLPEDAHRLDADQPHNELLERILELWNPSGH